MNEAIKIGDVFSVLVFQLTPLSNSASMSTKPGMVLAWAVGSSRNRDNWQHTTLRHVPGVLQLITKLAMERRDVDTLDPTGRKHVFNGCKGLGTHFTGAQSESSPGANLFLYYLFVFVIFSLDVFGILYIYFLYHS